MGTRPDPWLPVLFLALAITLSCAAAAQEPTAPDTKVAAAGKDGASAPQCLYCPQPKFSKQARKHHIEGVVLLDVTVWKDGQITDLTVKKTPGYGLEDQALQIIPTWKMKPCTKDDRPVNCRVTIEVSFKFT
jgi:TonB family protein